jgi:hypothetical protein
MVCASLFVVKMNIPTEEHSKTYKVDVKTVESSISLAFKILLPAGSQQKNSNRSGGAHKSIRINTNKMKNEFSDLVYILTHKNALFFFW